MNIFTKFFRSLSPGSHNPSPVMIRRFGYEIDAENEKIILKARKDAQDLFRSRHDLEIEERAIKGTGTMTDQEKKVIEASISLWNEFCLLPIEQTDQESKMQFHIHAIQDMIFARTAIREYRKEEPNFIKG